MQRARQSLQAGAVAQERVAQRAADQMGRVRRDVAALVVAVQREVQPQQVLEVLVLDSGLAERRGVVVRPVPFRIVALTVLIAIDSVRPAVHVGGHVRQLGKEGDAVVEGVVPVVGLADASRVGGGEGRVLAQSGDPDGELRHGMHLPLAGPDDSKYRPGQLGLLREFCRESADLRDRWNASGEQQPEHGLGQHLGTGAAFGELRLAVGDGATMEADTFIRIQDRAFPDESC